MGMSICPVILFKKLCMCIRTKQVNQNKPTSVIFIEMVKYLRCWLSVPWEIPLLGGIMQFPIPDVTKILFQKVTKYCDWVFCVLVFFPTGASQDTQPNLSLAIGACVVDASSQCWTCVTMVL